MVLSSTSFKKGNTLSKGNTGAERHAVYDTMWKEALEAEAKAFLKKLIECRDYDDKNISLRACDIFFKYARPPENRDFIDPSRNDAAMELALKYNLSTEHLKAIQQAGIKAQQAKLQEFLG